MSDTLGIVLGTILIIVVLIILEGAFGVLMRPMDWCYDVAFRKQKVRGWRLALSIAFGLALLALLVYSALWSIPSLF